MKLYRISWLCSWEGNQILWAGSLKEAKRMRKEVCEVWAETSPGLIPEFETDLVNVPTGKRALIEWLNLNLNSDNG